MAEALLKIEKSNDNKTLELYFNGKHRASNLQTVQALMSFCHSTWEDGMGPVAYIIELRDKKSKKPLLEVNSGKFKYRTSRRPASSPSSRPKARHPDRRSPAP